MSNATPSSTAAVLTDHTTADDDTQATARARALAERLEQGARGLAALAADLSIDQWGLRLPGDGRPVGVIVHHVASVYPIEISLAQTLAAGQPIQGVTKAAIDAM